MLKALLLLSLATLSCKRFSKNSDLNAPVPKKAATKSSFFESIVGKYEVTKATTDKRIPSRYIFCDDSWLEIKGLTSEKKAEENAAIEAGANWKEMSDESKAKLIAQKKTGLEIHLPKITDRSTYNVFHDYSDDKEELRVDARGFEQVLVDFKNSKVYELSFQRAAMKGTAVELDFSEENKMVCKEYSLVLSDQAKESNDLTKEIKSLFTPPFQALEPETRQYEMVK